MLSQKIGSLQFEGKVRVRACGLLYKDGKILLLKHLKIGIKGFLWSPPGGGLKFGESIEDCLIREFKEETSLNVKIKKFLFVNEYIDARFHAIEVFFEVVYQDGELHLGKDPELNDSDQVLSEARFFSKEDLSEIPKEYLHNAFRNTNDGFSLNDLQGLISFKV